MPTDGWMDKEDVYRIEYYLAIKRWIFVINNKMDGPWGYYAKWNKSDGKRQILYDFTHMWDKQTNRSKHIDREQAEQ